MKNKKVILVSVIVIVLTIISIIVIKYIFNKDVNFETLMNAKNYDINLKYFEDAFNDGTYVLNEEAHYNLDFENDYEYIERDDDKFYNYKGKQIFSTNKKTDNNETVWFYYEPRNDYFISFPGSDNSNYKQSLINLVEELSNLKYTKKGNIYVNSKNIDEKLNNYLSEVYSFQKSGYIDDIEYTNTIDKIEIITEQKRIKQINFYIVLSCSYEYPDLCDFDNEKLEIVFNEADQENYELPFEVQTSLEETTAGDWIGTYSYEIPCLNCSEPKNIKNQLTLTDTFNFSAGRGWDVEYSLYDGKYINSGSKTYYLEDNNLYIVNSQLEILTKGRIIDNKIELYDQNGNVNEIFVKE